MVEGNIRPGGGTADTQHFPPEADPPLAGKSSHRMGGGMNVDGLGDGTGAYVLVGSDGAYMYKGSARDVRKRVSDHLAGRVTRTRNRRPLEVLHIEYTVGRHTALKMLWDYSRAGSSPAPGTPLLTGGLSAGGGPACGGKI